MFFFYIYEPRHNKTNKMAVRPTKTQISLGIRPVWSELSLSAWRKLGSLATHWAHTEDSDQTGRTLILLVLSCHGSYFPTLLINHSWMLFEKGFWVYRMFGQFWQEKINIFTGMNETQKPENEPRHDKTNKMNVRPAKTQISLGIRPIWSESSLSAWRNLVFLATH